mgnify:CR=1 FL=1
MDVVVDGVSSVLANLAVRHVQSDHLFQDAIQVKGVALLYALVSDWIVAYVQLFDRLLKGYLDGSLSASDVEMAYRGDLRSRTLLI